MASNRLNDLDHLIVQANAEYHDLIADEYEADSSTALIFTPKVQQKLNAVVKRIRERTQDEIWVDVGCGTGNVLKFARQVFHRAIGLDVSVGMLRISRSRGLSVGIGSAQALPIPSSKVAAVSMFSVLHHIYDLQTVLSEIYRVLKPGGYFYADLDPNGICLIRKPTVRLLYRRIYTWYLMLTHLLAHREFTSVAAQDDIARLESLAEYHQNQTSGLDPRSVVRDLKGLGFRKVGVCLSFGTLDPMWLIGPWREPSALSLLVNPLFSIIAQK